jgi:hypothetical protein
MIRSKAEGLISEVERRPGGILSLLGIALGTLVLAYLVTHPDPPVWWETEVAVAVVLSSVVVYAGYRLNEDEFSSSDAWRVLKMSVAGMVGAVAIGGIFYLQQTVEGVRVVEPTFVIEYLGLAGGAFGAGYGFLLVSGSEGRTGAKETEQVHEATEEEAASHEGGVEDPVAIIRGDATGEAANDRLSVIECLLEEGGGETPVPSLAVFLTRKEAFPNDDEEAERLLREDHLPALSEAGVLEVDEDVDVVRYTGPKVVVSQLHEKEAA